MLTEQEQKILKEFIGHMSYQDVYNIYKLDLDENDEYWRVHYILKNQTYKETKIRAKEVADTLFNIYDRL